MIIKQILEAGTDPSLADFATRHKLFFHSSEWLSCYSETLRQAAILNNNKEIIGCFVFYEFRKAGMKFIITPPWMPDIALHFLNPAESVVGKNSFVKDLMKTLAEFFDGLGAKHVSINLPPSIADTQPFLWNGFSSRVRHTYLLDLGLPEEQLRQNLSPEKRKSLNKAQKDQIAVQETADAGIVTSLVLKSLSRNEKNKNTAILKRIIESFTGTEKCIAAVAHAGDAPIAATFCIIEGSRVIYLFGGYDAEKSHHGAGVSCMWFCIQQAKKRNLSVFDFEGSMNPDIERYFREFGGQITAYQCVEKISPVVKLLMRLKGHKPN